MQPVRSFYSYRTPDGEKRWGWLPMVFWLAILSPVFLYGVWKRTGWKTATKWGWTALVVTPVVVAAIITKLSWAALVTLSVAFTVFTAIIVITSIPGVNATAACNAMKQDGLVIQGAVDLYYHSTGTYPDATGGDKATPAAGDLVDTAKLKTANILNGLPPASEVFTYNAPPWGTVHGTLAPNSAGCAFN